MQIRLGYVAISKTLDVTTSSTITYTNFVKENYPYKKLNKIIESNLDDLERILNYNIKNNIHFYRLTSKLIPLATHKEVDFDYIKPFKDKFKYLGKLISDSKMRVDVHPDQFCVLNSTNSDIVKNSIEMLEYHYRILDLLNIKDKVIILHVGGNAFGKNKSISRFINNFNKLPNYLKKSIVIENDDKIFNLEDVLYIAKKTDIPVVLDYHHFLCNRGAKDIEDLIRKAFSTWKRKKPKIHFSSPKSRLKKDFRAHHDYIDINTFIDFLPPLSGVKINLCS